MGSAAPPALTACRSRWKPPLPPLPPRPAPPTASPSPPGHAPDTPRRTRPRGVGESGVERPQDRIPLEREGHPPARPPSPPWRGLKDSGATGIPPGELSLRAETSLGRQEGSNVPESTENLRWGRNAPVGEGNSPVGNVPSWGRYRNPPGMGGEL